MEIYYERGTRKDVWTVKKSSFCANVCEQECPCKRKVIIEEKCMFFWQYYLLDKNLALWVLLCGMFWGGGVCNLVWLFQ